MNRAGAEEGLNAIKRAAMLHIRSEMRMSLEQAGCSTGSGIYSFYDDAWIAGNSFAR